MEVPQDTIANIPSYHDDLLHAGQEMKEHALSPKNERMVNVDLMTAYDILPSPDYDDVMANPLTEIEATMSDSAANRRVISAEINGLQAVAHESQEWIDELSKLRGISKHFAKKDKEFHRARIDRYNAVLGEHTDHDTLVEHLTNEGFGEKLRSYLGERVDERPEAVADFIGSGSDQKTDPSIVELYSQLTSVPAAELVSIFDKRGDRVLENVQHVSKNLKGWTNKILEDMKLEPRVAEMLEKRLWCLSPVRVDDPITRNKSLPEGDQLRFLLLDGTKSQALVESSAKTKIAQWLDDDLAHLSEIPADTFHKAEGTLHLLQEKQPAPHEPPTEYDKLLQEIDLYENAAQAGIGEEYTTDTLAELKEVKRIMTQPENSIEEKLGQFKDTRTKIRVYLRMMRLIPEESKSVMQGYYEQMLDRQIKTRSSAD